MRAGGRRQNRMAMPINWVEVDLTRPANPCPICDKEFSTRGGMVAHAREKHMDDLLAIAEACSEMKTPPAG